MWVRRSSKSLFFLNVRYALVGTSVSLVVSGLVTLLVPKLIGVTEFGYWQLYLLYASFVHLPLFGWNEGILLRLGGRRIEDTPRFYYRQQFLCQLIYVIVLSGFFAVGAWESGTERAQQYILFALIAAFPLTNLRLFTQKIFHATKEVSSATKSDIVDRVLFGILGISAVVLTDWDYRGLIAASLSARMVSLLYGLARLRSLSSGASTSVRTKRQITTGLSDSFGNIRVGLSLMLAEMAALLSLGTGRIVVERVWGVATFGQIALGFSIVGLATAVLNSLGVVLFPFLRSLDADRLRSAYRKSRFAISSGVLVSLLALPLVVTALTFWLPQYSEGLDLLVFLFPILLFETRLALLLNSYLKSLWLQKWMLVLNTATLVVGIALTLTASLVVGSLELTVLSITVTSWLRSLLSELIVTRALRTTVLADSSADLILVAIFVAGYWYYPAWGTLVYFCILVIYFAIRRHCVSGLIGAIIRYRSS